MKKGINGKQKGFIIALAVLAIALLTGALVWCGGLLRGSEELLLHLSFDEQSGEVAADESGNLQEAEVHYRYLHAAYMENLPVEWRDCGVKDGCLLFDGNSVYLEYGSKDLPLGGEALTISVWLAPRAFEWDNPYAAERGEEKLTAVVSQYDSAQKKGVLLGYQRFGRLSFQVGTGEEWLTLWADEARLERYAWNQVTAVFDGTRGSMALYLNGEQIAACEIEKGTQILAAEREKLLVGKNSEADQIAAGTYQMYAGLMDELKVYGDALTAERIEAESNVSPAAIPFESIWLSNVLTEDPYKTQFHGGPYQHWMNEPHAPLYYNGKYHLFYQSNMVGTYWRNICWGHLVSEDLVNWEPIKEAIVPTEGSVVPDGVWSGGATTDKNGVPILFFTAGNDSYATEGLLSNQNIGVAYPADLTDSDLTEWVIGEELAITQQDGQGRIGEFRDPHIWKDGEKWYMLICTGSTQTNGGSAILYVTETLQVQEDGQIEMDWQYLGPIWEMEDPSIRYGTSWELPILLPISNEAGNITRYVFLFSPAPASIADNKIFYFVGDFDEETGTFQPDASFDGEPALLDYGCNVLTGPSAFLDPQSGQLCLFSIMQDQRDGAEEGAAGWAHCVGLTRTLWLNDDGTDLKMSPLDALQNLEQQVLVEAADLSLEEANQQLEEIAGDLLYVRVSFAVGEDASCGVVVKADEEGNGTSFQYEDLNGMISADIREKGAAASSNYVNGALDAADGILDMEVYIDRSLVEAFFNDSKSISVRTYSDPEEQGIRLEGEGEVRVTSLYVAEMGSIFAGEPSGE